MWGSPEKVKVSPRSLPGSCPDAGEYMVPVLRLFSWGIGSCCFSSVCFKLNLKRLKPFWWNLSCTRRSRGQSAQTVRPEGGQSSQLMPSSPVQPWGCQPVHWPSSMRAGVVLGRGLLVGLREGGFPLQPQGQQARSYPAWCHSICSHFLYKYLTSFSSLLSSLCQLSYGRVLCPL